MADAPLRRCPRCNQKVRGRCERCKPKLNASKNRPGDPFYSSKVWRDLRAIKLAADPLCSDCEAEGRITPATEVDHIKPRREFPEIALTLENLDSKCKSCHSKKTAKERARGA